VFGAEVFAPRPLLGRSHHARWYLRLLPDAVELRVEIVFVNLRTAQGAMIFTQAGANGEVQVGAAATDHLAMNSHVNPNRFSIRAKSGLRLIP
jgi:hypothetical protein